VNLVLQRLFGASTRKQTRTSGAPLENIQHSLRKTLAGCSGIRADRLLYQIELAKTPAELWALRSDLHQCIAQARTESVAAERINGLISVFAGWVPSAQLSKIQPDFRPSKGW
jgi:hypothetical protein